MSDSRVGAKSVARSTTTRLLGLDLLRVVAALWVGLHHLGFCAWADPAGYARALGLEVDGLRGLAPVAACGWVGVEIFFVLSGLVIAYSASSTTPKRFLRSRFLRLMPALWICSLGIAALQWMAGMPVARTLRVLASTMVVAPLGPYLSTVYWTLSVEIIFYLSVFLVMYSRRADRLERLAVLLGALSTLSWTVYVLASSRSSLSPLLTRVVHALAYSPYAERMLLQHGCFFAVGILVWRIQQTGVTRARLVWSAVFLATCLTQIVIRNRQLGEFLSVPLEAWRPVLAFLVVTSATVLSVFHNASLSRLFSARAQRVISTAGLASYPFYLLHETVGLVVMRSSLRLYPSAGLALTMGLLTSAVLALIVSTWLEPRLRAVVARMWRVQPDAAPRAPHEADEPGAASVVSARS